MNLKTPLFFLALSVLFSLEQTHAHPVAFQGAKSILSESDSSMKELMTTYSYRYYLAPALSYVQIEKNDFAFLGVNGLLKRWNQPTSQGNIYLSVAQGLEFREQTNKQHNTSRVSLDVDWEDRRYYTSARYSRIFRSGEFGEDIELKKLRLGFAPYLGNYKELNTWFIVQASQMDEKVVEVTPLLRFYYQNVLWEVGSSLRGNWLFNFMIHI